jgi:aminopeptidase
MIDPRIDRMAQTITGYSLALKPGDLLRIEAPALAQVLIRAVYAEALKAGAHVMTRIGLEGIAEEFYRNASAAQLAFVGDVEKLEVERLTARLVIGGNWNTRSMRQVDPAKLATQRQARRELFTRLLERKAAGELKSCITHFPAPADAQQAELSLREYEDFVFRACFCDRDDPIAEWRRLSQYQAGVVERLSPVRQLRIEAADTDLELSVAGRTWINSDGRANFPSGEVFTAPVEDSATGRIRFEFPAIMSGQEVNDIRLRFDRGRVVAATAARGEDYLQAMLRTDAGAQALGEVAFGLNPGIQRFTHNILFDEKIGGTMHFALGAAYPECGGRNRSAIHWDMIKDLRRQGRVYADGSLIYENGRFI